MKRLALLLALAGSLVPRLDAQGSTQDLLQQASAFYERLDVERALPLLRQVVSPSWPFEVTAAQRVAAYKYLGASLHWWERATPPRCTSAPQSSGTRSRISILPSSHPRNSVCLGKQIGRAHV